MLHRSTVAMAVAAATITLALFSLPDARAQGAGGNAAGLIDSHLNQQMRWQRNAPYLFRPVQPEDYLPLEDIEGSPIEIHDAEVQGTVIPKLPSPDEINIK